jgi:peptidylprolyl isomerase
MGKLILAIVVCASLGFFGCGGSDSPEKTKPTVTVPEGPPPKKPKIKDLELGSGDEAKAGDEPTVQYVGVTYKDGNEVITSWGRKPFTFLLGEDLIYPAWDRAVEGMKVGGRRELIMPPQSGNRASSTNGSNEAIVYVIDLIAVK